MPAIEERRPAPSVWVVEDDEEVLRLLLEVFEGSSFEVRGFSHAQAALESLREGRPDVLVLDWHLPPSNGWPVLQELRESGAALPVIVLTGDVRLQPREGVAAVFRKPVRLEALVSKVLELGSGAHAPHAIA